MLTKIAAGKIYGALTLILGGSFLACQLVAADTAVLSGIVRSPDGEVNGTVVKAKKGNISFAVIANKSGHYEIPALETGTYTVDFTLPGHPPVERNAVQLSAGKNNLDITLDSEKNVPSQVAWADFHNYAKGLPPDPERAAFERTCNPCHGLNFILSKRRTEAGWRQVLNYMNYIRAREDGFENYPYRESDERLVHYLAKTMGPDSPPFPAIEPIGAPIKEEATKAVFKVYDTSPRGTVHTMMPDAKGNVWFSSWLGVKEDFIGKLNTSTGEVSLYKTGSYNKHTHGICVDNQRQFVYFTENFGNKLGQFDTKTETFKLLQAQGTPHSCVVDPDAGDVWFTLNESNEIGKLDRASGKIVRFTVPTPKSEPYGIVRDVKTGAIWFAEAAGNKVGKVDPKTGQMTEFEALTKPAGVKRLGVDSKGNVWFGEMTAHKLGRIDAKTGKVREFEPPTKYSAPYGLVVDKNDIVWIAGFDDNRLMRFDPATEAFLEIPMPSFYTGVRVMDVDSTNRLWMAGSTFGQVVTIDFKHEVVE